MGLWNFIKTAGKAIGIGSAEAAEPADAIRAEIEDLGLDASGVEIAVDGDTVKVTGKAVDQETREKIILAAGNVEGIAAVDEDVSAPDAKEPVFHTVEKGDTLWAIASKHLGNGSRYPEIFEANKPMLSDPDKIYPGQNLRIPDA
ncbi:MAG: peptidoglycan-binding protein LysM [Paracoccaceae bacterium]|nr:peptidoglycan-binding protein LysM [Paracoccaceae bacterium]